MSEEIVRLLLFCGGFGVGTALQCLLRKLDARIERAALEMIRDGNPYLFDHLQSAWMQKVAEQALLRRDGG